MKSFGQMAQQEEEEQQQVTELTAPWSDCVRQKECPSWPSILHNMYCRFNANRNIHMEHSIAGNKQNSRKSNIVSKKAFNFRGIV